MLDGPLGAVAIRRGTYEWIEEWNLDRKHEHEHERSYETETGLLLRTTVDPAFEGMEDPDMFGEVSTVTLTLKSASLFGRLHALPLGV